MQKNMMRRVAGVLYLVAFIAELYLFKPLYLSYSLVAVPIFVWALVIAGTGAGAVWMFAGQGLINKTGARAATAVTALVVLKTLVLYDLENELLGMVLSELHPTLAENNVWNYVIIIVRLMLLIVAAFFVLNASEEPAPAGDEESGEEEEEIVVEGEEGTVAVEAQAAKQERDRLAEIESDMDKSLPGNDR